MGVGTLYPRIMYFVYASAKFPYQLLKLLQFHFSELNYLLYLFRARILKGFVAKKNIFISISIKRHSIHLEVMAYLKLNAPSGKTLYCPEYSYSRQDYERSCFYSSCLFWLMASLLDSCRKNLPAGY